MKRISFRKKSGGCQVGGENAGAKSRCSLKKGEHMGQSVELSVEF